MGGPLSGVRAVEVASHVFVPMAGTVLTEWGADVVKIEHPVTGDPYRGLVTSGLHNEYRGVDPFFQSANRGKRSVGIDLGRPEGRELLGRLIREADVFLTSLRPAARRRLRVEVEDVRADNPAVVYVRGSAFGARGPDAGRGGYDVSTYWARSGMQYVLTPPGAPAPLGTRPAFGDVVGGLTIAGAVSAALFSRASTGHAAVVDASLLASGMWQVQPDIVNAVLGGGGATDAPPERARTSNPLTLPYRTADGRHVALIMVESDRRWPELCAALGHPEMADDPRWADAEARRRNARSCVARLDEVFAARTLEEWRACAGGPRRRVGAGPDAGRGPRRPSGEGERLHRARSTWAAASPSRWSLRPCSSTPSRDSPAGLPSTASTPRARCSSSAWTGTRSAG